MAVVFYLLVSLPDARNIIHVFHFSVNRHLRGQIIIEFVVNVTQTNVAPPAMHLRNVTHLTINSLPSARFSFSSLVVLLSLCRTHDANQPNGQSTAEPKKRAKRAPHTFYYRISHYMREKEHNRTFCTNKLLFHLQMAQF